MDESEQLAQAEADFFKARRKAVLSSIFAGLRGQSTDMLSFEEARKLLRPTNEAYEGVKTVEIAKIVGSEGRYRDFDRNFLPRRKNTRRRWQNISVAHQLQIDLPAIKVYDLGGLYFIRDGNHRVSVARQRGVEFIDAEVTGISTKIDVGTVRDRDELQRAVIEYERGRFLQSLSLVDKLRDTDFLLTAVGGYDYLVLHIGSHKKLVESRTQTQISYEEATRWWYELIYLPITKLIRDSGVLAILPNRTEADFYVWLIRHWDEVSSMVAADLPRPRRLQRRFSASFAG